MVESVVRELQAHEGELELKVDRAEFEDLAFRVIDNVVREHQEEKIEAYTRFLANSLVADGSAERRDLVLLTLEQISILELRILALIASMSRRVLEYSKDQEGPPFLQNPERGLPDGPEPPDLYAIQGGEAFKLLGVEVAIW
ncbi:MAG: hypothetical protein BGO01_18780 [Armatimonadetes bacterium 55-13]|nr:MAG: hypothetical protein BGO01_18780 [Armatimonadetes bacterium 55-13]